jgi:hypothetical protein
MMLSFLLCAALTAMMVVVSLLWPEPAGKPGMAQLPPQKPTALVAGLWTALAAVMVALYLYFN